MRRLLQIAPRWRHRARACLAAFVVPPRWGVCWALVLAIAAAGSSRAAELGLPIEEFTLRDSHGREHALASTPDTKAFVVVFLGVECPLANLYAPRLNELAERFAARGVVFYGVNSNRQDSNSELAAYVEQHRFSFPQLKDVGNVIADRFGAERTPEAFVLDGNRVLRYRGRIDNQYEVGVQRAAATRHDLRFAVEAVLDGKEVFDPSTEAPGCFIGRTEVRQREGQPASAAGDITWSSKIADIIQRRCQECHRPGQFAPFPLLTFDDALGWAETIREVVTLERMPPWNANPAHGQFSNDLRLTPEEKSALLAWIDAGAPQGDPEKLPAPREYASGWRIGEPDQIVYLAEKPFEVPADGVVDYQWFYVDPGFKEDRWVQAVEARPGARQVVHHVTVYHKPPWGDWDMQHNTRINLLGGFNPGGEPLVLPPGHAIYLPAGTQFAFEMHYTPNGVVQQDRSHIGLVFAEPGDVKKEVQAFMPADTKIDIPPGEADYRSRISYRFPEDMDLMILRPHMHLRGKSFRYEAVYPGGEREILLDVPRFDFNWQHSYYLAQPKRMPRGTELVCSASFDNSAENPSNPDPAARVRWGDQSWDEMMIGIFCATPVVQHWNNYPLAYGTPRARRIAFVVLAGGIAAVLAAIYWQRGRHVTG